ncbi:MAG: hypothetical protein K6F75_04815 [Butyrivibrio sp.]|nr:hypothetical protein [Butyrivibrio sp.]
MNIVKKSVAEDKVGDFINEAFTDYAVTNNVTLNFEEYWFVAEDDSGEIIGTITARL